MMSLKSYTKYGTYIYEEKSNLGFLFFFMKNSNANKLTSQIGLLNNLLNTKKTCWIHQQVTNLFKLI